MGPLNFPLHDSRLLKKDENHTQINRSKSFTGLELPVSGRGGEWRRGGGGRQMLGLVVRTNHLAKIWAFHLRHGHSTPANILRGVSVYNLKPVNRGLETGD
jgi:hypothetical protein